MNRFAFLVLITILVFCQFGVTCVAASEGISITREPVAKITFINPDNAIGFRVSGDKAFFVDRDGATAKADLNTGTVKSDNSSLNKVRDFALNNGNPVFLTTDATTEGAVDPAWPKGPFGACRIESESGDAYLMGNDNLVYLPKNATSAVMIPGLFFAMPIQNGFIYTIRQESGTKIWGVELLDSFGNRMKRIYRFTRDFDPTGIQLGPIGTEGEVLLSYWSKNQRELALIGQNGRMLWKIPVPKPVCMRDLGWDAKGNLLVLEKEGGSLVLYRWVFAIPQG